MRASTGWLALLLLSCSAGGQAAVQFDGEAAWTYVARQMEFGPRIPNTEGHRRTGDWIHAHLLARADSVAVQSFRHVTVDGDTLDLRNFFAAFRPEMGERVLFLAHWDTRPTADADPNLDNRRLPTPGANDGGSGVAVLLGLADALSRHPPRYGVDLLFVDGEDYGDFGRNQDVFIGSRYFADNLAEGYRPLFAVLFDMVGDADLALPREGNSHNRAREVVDRVWRAAEELGFGDVFRDEVGTWVTDDHIPLLDVGIRAIDVIDFTYGEGGSNSYHHTREDTLDKVSAESLGIVGSVALALVR